MNDQMRQLEKFLQSKNIPFAGALAEIVMAILKKIEREEEHE